MPSVHVYKAFLRQELMGIHLTRDGIKSIRQSSWKLRWWNRPFWKIEQTTENVPLVMGELSGDASLGELEHVHWLCPACGTTHSTDVDSAEDPNPSLWFCEHGRDGRYFLVGWNEKTTIV